MGFLGSLGMAKMGFCNLLPGNADWSVRISAPYPNRKGPLSLRKHADANNIGSREGDTRYPFMMVEGRMLETQ